MSKDVTERLRTLEDAVRRATRAAPARRLAGHLKLETARRVTDVFLGDATQVDANVSIVDAEAHLHRNGTRIVKIFLHLSKDEQRDRLIARIDEEDKNWKFDEGDIEQRKHWDKYMAAYADCLRATSTPDCPWYVVPADDKKNARLIVSQILVDTLAGLDLHYPETSPARREKLLEIRRQLEAGEV